MSAAERHAEWRLRFWLSMLVDAIAQHVPAIVRRCEREVNAARREVRRLTGRV